MDTTRLVLSGGDVVFPDGITHGGVVIIEGDRITAIEHTDEYTPFETDRVIDCSDSFVCPGFIDLHNQGGNGFDVMDGTVESIYGMCRAHAAHGTTGLLLTPQVVKNGFRTLLGELADLVGTDTGGSAVLGIHTEGPFTNPEKRGCMPFDAIMKPDKQALDAILDCGKGTIVEMTIAPELPGSLALINRLAREGIVVSLGHSDATLNEVLMAIDYGATHVTHFFNTMSPIHHREPGLAGTALYSHDLTVEIIADGFHIHPWIMGLTLQNKSPARTCLITDAMSVMGMDDGEYESMGQRVVLENGRLSMADNPSILAGSVLSLDIAVGNIINMLGIPIVDAVTMASTTPSAVIGLENSKGRIEIGYDADIAILDRTYRTRKTILQGDIIYERES